MRRALLAASTAALILGGCTSAQPPPKKTQGTSSHAPSYKNYRTLGDAQRASREQARKNPRTSSFAGFEVFFRAAFPFF